MKTNFYDFCNSFRLHYFLQLTRDPQFNNLTLLAKAYEAGFNSKTTFNTYFKKSMGTTPSEYLKSTL